MNYATSLLTLAAVLSPLGARADDLPPPVKAMDCLVGTWKLAGTASAGGGKAKVDGTWSCKRTPSNFGVTCALRLTGIPGLNSYEETDLFGWEPNTSTYHWFSVTNAGETHDHMAAMPKGDSLRFVHTGTSEGKPFKEVIDMTFSKGSKELTVRSETFVAGASTSVLEVKGRK